MINKDIFDAEQAHYERIHLAELDAEMESEGLENAIPLVAFLKPDVVKEIRRLYGNNIAAFSGFVNRTLETEFHLKTA